MSFQKGLIVFIILSILMAKLKPTRGRIYEGKYKNHREVNKLNYHSFQTRHQNHYWHKKHHKCHLDGPYNKQAHSKRLSRYPTLDKIVHRLDNRVDFLEKANPTTASPFDDWNSTSSLTTSFPDKSTLYTFYAVGTRGEEWGRKGLGRTRYSSDTRPDENAEITLVGGWGDNARSGGNNGSEVDADEDEFTIGKKQRKDNNTNDNNRNNDITVESSKNNFSKGYMQDHSTSSPMENEQQDVSSRTKENLTETLSTFSASSSTSTSLPFSSTPSPSPPFTLTNKKDFNFSKVPFWSISRLGPRKTSGEDRKKPTTPMPYVAAHEHYEQILRMGDCHIPKEKVIRVHEVHPDPSKSYSPSCTILHQCGDDTGCCRDLKQVCKPKNTTKVELYFFTTTLGKPQTVEKLHFVNHTECECQKRTEETMPRDSEFRRHQLKKLAGPKGPEEKKNSCLCPSKYSVRYLRNDSCVCDCFDKQDDCLILKKGKIHFSYHDKLCIQQGICLQPSCEFGFYIRQFGRCPNRSEKYHYRWSRVLYRDLIS